MRTPGRASRKAVDLLAIKLKTESALLRDLEKTRRSINFVLHRIQVHRVPTLFVARAVAPVLGAGHAMPDLLGIVALLRSRRVRDRRNASHGALAQQRPASAESSPKDVAQAPRRKPRPSRGER